MVARPCKNGFGIWASMALRWKGELKKVTSVGKQPKHSTLTCGAKAMQAARTPICRSAFLCPFTGFRGVGRLKTFSHRSRLEKTFFHQSKARKCAGQSYAVQDAHKSVTIVVQSKNPQYPRSRSFISACNFSSFDTVVTKLATWLRTEKHFQTRTLSLSATKRSLPRADM